MIALFTSACGLIALAICVVLIVRIRRDGDKHHGHHRSTGGVVPTTSIAHRHPQPDLDWPRPLSPRLHERLAQEVVARPVPTPDPAAVVASMYRHRGKAYLPRYERGLSVEEYLDEEKTAALAVPRG